MSDSQGFHEGAPIGGCARRLVTLTTLLLLVIRGFTADSISGSQGSAGRRVGATPPPQLEDRAGNPNCSLTEQELEIYYFEFEPEQNLRYEKQKKKFTEICCNGEYMEGKCADWLEGGGHASSPFKSVLILGICIHFLCNLLSS